MDGPFTSWSDVRLFLAVAREGSTAAAARQLGMTQTTLSRRLTGLEQKLGLTLFVRDTRGFHLTNEGEALLGPAAAVEDAARAFGQKAEALTREPTLVCRITATATIFDFLVAPVTSAFSEQRPGVTFVYVSGEGYLDLEAGEADIAFRVIPSPRGDRLLCRRLPDIKWSLYAGKAYAEKHGAPADVRALAGHRIVGYGGAIEQSEGYRWLLDHVDGELTAKCDSLSNMRSILRANVGVGPLACGIGDSDPELVRCFDPPPEMSAPFWLFSSPRAHASPVIRDFTAFAAERVAAHLVELQGPPLSDSTRGSSAVERAGDL